MARQARGEVINALEVQIVHAVQRCVRRAFLCGKDSYSGKSFEHRRRWIRDRFEFLASIFGIDCLTYSVMHNHMHIVLRSRPDVVQSWSDIEVARRWLTLFPIRRNKDGSAAEPTEPEVATIISDPLVLTERRRRLSDISWWMRCTAEAIARQANREDECSGRFWEGRFKGQLILDEAGLLACAAYVDLNPIRAAMAEAPETSEYTGAKERLDDLSERQSKSTDTHAWERSSRRRWSAWLSPIEIREASDKLGANACSSGRRASDRGFLSCSLAEYLQLLDWTGRQMHKDKVGTIPQSLAPVLSRIGLDGSGWCDLVQRFGHVFKRAAGTAEHLAAEAQRRGQNWMQASTNPLAAAS